MKPLATTPQKFQTIYSLFAWAENKQLKVLLAYVREKHCWLAENKRLKAQANRLLINSPQQQQLS
jgi:hypothetical protein